MLTIDEVFKILTEYEDNYKNPDDKDKQTAIMEKHKKEFAKSTIEK